MVSDHNLPVGLLDTHTNRQHLETQNRKFNHRFPNNERLKKKETKQETKKRPRVYKTRRNEKEQAKKAECTETNQRNAQRERTKEIKYKG